MFTMLLCKVTRDNRVAGTSQQNRQITCDQARNVDRALYCGSGGELRIHWKDRLFGSNSIYTPLFNVVRRDDDVGWIKSS